MKDLTISTSTLPSLATFNSFDIIGNTIGRYFDYKQNTELIKHETKKLEKQTEVLLKKIDSELESFLASNKSNFIKEMKRLDNIAQSLASNTLDKAQRLEHISELVSMLSNQNISIEIKQMIPELIKQTNIEINNSNELSLKYINNMYNPNVLEEK